MQTQVKQSLCGFRKVPNDIAFEIGGYIKTEGHSNVA